MDVIDLVQREIARRGYSPRTSETYTQCLKQFFRIVEKDALKVTKNDVTKYLDRLVDRNLASETLNVHYCALVFLFHQVLRRKLMITIRTAKKRQRIPISLSKEEVSSLLFAIDNQTHRLLVSLMYGAGLRVSEVCSLRVVDIEADILSGWVREGKGKKDRMFLIPACLRSILAGLLIEQEREGVPWLFPGRDGPLTTRTVYSIVKTATKRAGIRKNVHPHVLRHSFATHLIENGVSIAIVQGLLGHASLDTTVGYVHATIPRLIGVESPLDSLQGFGNCGEGLITD